MKNGRLILLVSIGLLLASIGNGAVGYLKRIGVIDRVAYIAYVNNVCGLENGRTLDSPCECMCIPEPVHGPIGGGSGNANDLPAPNYLFHSVGAEQILKLGKDA